MTKQHIGTTLSGVKLEKKQKAIIGPWIEAERIRQNLYKNVLLQRAGGMSPATYGRLINPEDEVRPNQATVEAFMLALGYSGNSWELVLQGEDPVPTEQVPPGQRDDLLLEEVREVKDRLAAVEDVTRGLLEALDRVMGLETVRRIDEVRRSIEGR